MSFLTSVSQFKEEILEDVCLIYLALVLCYAAQATFISKNLRASKLAFGVSSTQALYQFVHLSESVPNSE